MCRWPDFNGHNRRWFTNNGIPHETYSKKIQNGYIQHKNKRNGNAGKHIQRVKIVINDNIIEYVAEFKYLGHFLSEYKNDLEDKLQTYNKINGAIGRHYGKKKWTKKQS